MESAVFLADNIAELVVARLIRWRRWSPVGKHVSMTIDDSADPAYTGRTLTGIVRGYDYDKNRLLTRLLVELDQTFGFFGENIGPRVRWVVAEPCLRWRRTSRLLWSWAAARLVDAPSFVDSTYSRTVGIARLRLGRYHR